MVRLLIYDERSADSTGQAARGQTVWGRGNLAAADGKVFTTGDRVGGQGCLQDRAASRRSRSRDRGRDSCYAPPMDTKLPGEGIGVPPH